MPMYPILPLTSPTFSSRPSRNVLTVQRGVMKVSRLMPNIGSGAVVLALMSRGGLVESNENLKRAP